MPSQQRVRRAKMRAIGLAVVAVSILAVLLYLLAGPTLLEEQATIRVYVPDATGLGEGSPVRLNGIKIGEIESIQLSGRRDSDQVVEIRMRILRRYLDSVPRDSAVQISAETLIGDMYVDITKGESPQHIQPGGILPLQQQPEALKSLDIAQFRARLMAIDILLKDIEEGKGGFGRLVKGEELYGQLRNKLIGAQQALRTATSTQAALGQLIYTDALYRQLLEPIQRLEERLEEVRQGQGRMGKLLHDPALYNDITQRISNVRSTVAGLNAGKGPAGRWLESDELYERMNRRVVSVIQAVDQFAYGQGAVAHLYVSAQLYESLAGAAQDIRSAIEDFRSDPRKYLRVNAGLF